MNVAALKAQMALCSMKESELAEAIGLSKSALYRRMKGSASFSREDILNIMHALNLSDQCAMEIFFTEKCLKRN